jgi:glutamate synthase domain-containing protein 1/glutamate synthase domain-containing protein 3
MNKDKIINNIIRSREPLIKGLPEKDVFETVAEGGCGVTGFACNMPVGGKHIYEPSKQMHNRGNGRGGGIAAMGFDPRQLGVSRDVLENNYIIQVAVLEHGIMKEVEEKFITPFFNIDHSEDIPHIDDYRDIPGMIVRPPDVWRYFVRVKPDVLKHFIKKNKLEGLTLRQAEDEFVYQNTFKLNRAYYEAYGKQQAFVLSHGRNFFILKVVGYAEEVVQYYKLDDFKANVWIAHQRYPTKGRVWHPAGAHPFIGMNEALVHNGDFANYHSVTEYLRQRNITPQFLTDTEVSVLLFDLYSRTYKYPLEYVIEALAPTMERDFDQLTVEKQRIYRAIQASHIHASPDGPWFFIIARNDSENDKLQLIGITDTAMLRPQVFALHDGEIQVGLVCSEQQAIDATLKSLASEDPRIGTTADLYWNARGGSHTDGGSFIFNLSKTDDPDVRKLTCVDKFGKEIKAPKDQAAYLPDDVYYEMKSTSEGNAEIKVFFESANPDGLCGYLIEKIAKWNFAEIMRNLTEINSLAGKSDSYLETAIQSLTRLHDRRFPTYDKKRRSILQMIKHTIDSIFKGIASIDKTDGNGSFSSIDWNTRQFLRAPAGNEKVLVIDASLFQPEGEDCDSRLMADAYLKGWKKFIVFGLKGQRFHGCGFGPDTRGVQIDIYGNSGDYISSGMDGMNINIHGNAQDQLGQIMKSGKLVIYGHTGQTFMYGAKGGEVYVMGNAAGRPLINAVGKPRVVINGTALDYLGESFMAGDPLTGGGFVILNGMEFNNDGTAIPQATPYPGSNLFSLASGGAVYVRDPLKQIDNEQLNGGEVASLSEKDWELIKPYLEENERLFGISITKDLLKVDGEEKSPFEVYRKVRPKQAGPKDDEDGLEEWGD